MPYTILRIENRPVVIVHARGKLNGAAHFEIARTVADLVENTLGKIYLIIDLTQARLDLLSMVDVVTQMTRGWAGTASDPRIITMMVLRGGNSSLAAAHLIRGCEGWRRTYIFATLAGALACARGPFTIETEEAISVLSKATPAPRERPGSPAI